MFLIIRKECFLFPGPNSMVAAFEKNLRLIGVKRRNIKTDYFPGFNKHLKFTLISIINLV